MATIIQYIPLDKSWMIRMGFLDVMNGYNNIISYLDKQENLGDDLKALLRVARGWDKNEVLDVGESATLYRFFRFASWKLGVDKKFIRKGSLLERPINQNPNIISWSLEKLLTLDGGTSQWASASVLMGNKEEEVENPPYKLQLSYDALKYWKQRRSQGKCWQEKIDTTILLQASAYQRFFQKEPLNFEPRQSEDYCFARAFELITSEQGESLWGSLRGHESNRIISMEKALRQADSNQPISSKDHRIVQAIVMAKNLYIPQVEYPSCVDKSWPLFWDFLEVVRIS